MYPWISFQVLRIGIVITDGRSQDNVTMPSQQARDDGIQMFAIGVTDHVLVEELVQIAGTREKVYLRKNYRDLDKRLRSLIQKEACDGEHCWGIAVCRHSRFRKVYGVILTSYMWIPA